MKIYVCHNTETLIAADAHELPEHDQDYVAVAMVETIHRILEDAGHEPVGSQAFRDWHGGRHDQFHFRRYTVACPERKPPQAVVDAMDKADQSAIELRERLVSELLAEPVDDDE